MSNKLFLYGRYKLNSGPQNVNRDLIEVGDRDLLYVCFSNRILRSIETVVKCILADATIISGICTKNSFKLINRLSKRTYYLMHGCVEYENFIDNEGLSEEVLQLEKEILDKCSGIICVSKGYANWVSNRYPFYKKKITYVNNGLTVENRIIREKDKFSIALSGGNRPIKNNSIVCEAINLLYAEGIQCTVHVFGHIYDNKERLNADVEIKEYGQLEKNDYYDVLDHINLFVINSEIESFGLVIGDALGCHCSLLLSHNVGALELIKPLKENDIINNPKDAFEIARKIKYLLYHSNYDYIIKNLEAHDYSTRKMLNELKEICR